MKRLFCFSCICHFYFSNLDAVTGSRSYRICLYFCEFSFSQILHYFLILYFASSQDVNFYSFEARKKYGLVFCLALELPFVLCFSVCVRLG